MSDNATKPTDWHRKPADCDGPCPVCGLKSSRAGEHRLTPPETQRDRTHVKRYKGRSGWIYRPIGPKRPDRHRSGPGTWMQIRIIQAANYLAQGFTIAEIGKIMGVSAHTVRDWQKKHPKFWKLQVLVARQAMGYVLDVVRSQAGAAAAFCEPDKFVRLAGAADRAARLKGESLFSEGDELTLSSFFEHHYKTLRLSEASPATLRSYRDALRRWQRLTGDPPLSKITSTMLAAFRDALGRMRGKQPHLPMSPNTVRSLMRHLQTLLDKAGPPGLKNRDAVGLIDPVPWAKPPRAVRTPRTIVLMQHFRDAYATAPAPQVPGFKPAAWWRALLVLTLYTGLRRGTLFSLRMSDINWDAKQIRIPPERMKSRREHVVPLAAVVVEHLTKIRTDRELVFPWGASVGKCQHSFHLVFHRLQRLAGISKDEHFGLHALRRTLATILWETNPAAAQLMLGHVDVDVTRDFYVNPHGIIRRAVGALPSWCPAGANGTGGDAAGDT